MVRPWFELIILLNNVELSKLGNTASAKFEKNGNGGKISQVHQLSTQFNDGIIGISDNVRSYVATQYGC